MLHLMIRSMVLLTNMNRWIIRQNNMSLDTIDKLQIDIEIRQI